MARTLRDRAQGLLSVVAPLGGGVLAMHVARPRGAVHVPTCLEPA
jgi:hypothetical protein